MAFRTGKGLTVLYDVYDTPDKESGGECVIARSIDLVRGPSTCSAESKNALSDPDQAFMTRIASLHMRLLLLC